MPGVHGVSARDTGDMLTASTEANAVMEAVAAGATGYLQKVAGVDQVLGMMKSAAADEGRLPTELVRRVFDRIRSGAKRDLHHSGEAGRPTRSRRSWCGLRRTGCCDD